MPNNCYCPESATFPKSKANTVGLACRARRQKNYLQARRSLPCSGEPGGSWKLAGSYWMDRSCWWSNCSFSRHNKVFSWKHTMSPAQYMSHQVTRTSLCILLQDADREHGQISKWTTRSPLSLMTGERRHLWPTTQETELVRTHVASLYKSSAAFDNECLENL